MYEPHQFSKNDYEMHLKFAKCQPIVDCFVGHSFCVLCLRVIQNCWRETASYILNDGVIVNVKGYVFDVGD